MAFFLSGQPLPGECLRIARAAVVGGAHRFRFDLVPAAEAVNQMEARAPHAP